MPLRNLIAKLREKWSGRVASRRAVQLKSRRRLELEMLESRTLMATNIAPVITAVNPANSGSLVESTTTPNEIMVTYSEAMMTTGTYSAANASAYLLYGPNGISVPISSVSADGTKPNTFDVFFPIGQPAGNYTLFVKGDQVEAANGLMLSNPGQIVVANSSTTSGVNNISTVNAPDGFNAGTPSTLSATQTYALSNNEGDALNPLTLAVGDFNGDGIPDLAICTNISNGFGVSTVQINIYTGNSTGGFSASPATTLNLPASVFADGLDGQFDILAYYTTTASTSGYENILLRDTATGDAYIFTNTGTTGAVPTFNPVQTVSLGATSPASLTIGDFNGDGINDLAVVDGTADGAGNFNIYFLAGAGTGTFGALSAPFAIGNTATSTTTLQNPVSIAEGHLVTPTSVDLAVGGSNGVETIFNQGTASTEGTFTFKIGALYNSTTNASFLNNVSAVRIGYLTDDGSGDEQDIEGASNTSPTVEVLVNSQTGTGAINTVTSKTFSLGAGNDAIRATLSPETPGGKDDMVFLVNEGSQNQVEVLQNTSTTVTPSFSAGAFYTVDAAPHTLSVGDFNGDTHPDIITTSQIDTLDGDDTSGTFSVLRNNGDGTYGAPTVLNPTAAEPVAVATGDLNGDNIPDLVVANKSGNSVTVYLAVNGTPGTYSAGVTYPTTETTSGTTTGDGPVSVTLADLTGNGLLDIITANTDGTVSVLLNNPGDPGTFEGAVTYVVGEDPTQVVAGVFDNSGKISLAVSHDGTGPTVADRGVSLLIGNGDGTFKAAQEILPGVSATAIAAGNFTEAAGQPLDLVVADGENGTVELLRNNGKGVFSNDGADVYSVGADPVALAVGDFNRDGYEDVVAVSSDSSGANQQIAVLLNSAGDGFASAVFTPLPFNFPVNSVAVDDLNGYEYPDLILGLTGATPTAVTGSGFFGTNATVAADANVYSLIGNGDGTFTSPVPYMTGVKSDNTVVAVASDPLVKATTFSLISNIVFVNLIKNGNFGARDLDGTSGTFTGWEQYQDPNSAGGWYLQSGTLSPLSQTPVPAPPSSSTGTDVYQAMADESNLEPIGGGPNGSGNPIVSATNPNPNAASTYDGSNFLYQDVTLPSTLTSASELSFSMDLYLNSAADFTSGESALDFASTEGNPDQQVRVDFVSVTPVGEIDSAPVIVNLFQTTEATPEEGSYVITLTAAEQAALYADKGDTIRLRISVVNNQGRLTVGVDNVKLEAEYVDTTPPTISGPTLRNPGYQIPYGTGGATIADTTDPTLIGTVNDDGGVGNVKEVIFSTSSNFSTNVFVIGPTSFDADGNFSVQLPFLMPGLSPVTIYTKVIDDAGNVNTGNPLTFEYQSPSTTDWQAVGPNTINSTGVTASDLTDAQYNTVVGQINAVLVDPQDASGNTYLTAGDNGGIWRTTDGGVDWTPTTDYLFNADGSSANFGKPIDAPIGALGGAIDITTDVHANQFVVYAGLGDSDIEPDSQAGSGVLISFNGGVSWALAGDSDIVMANARISTIVVDPNNTAIAYAAVESGGEFGPGVYKTSNYGQTWTNVLTISEIFGPASNTTPLFATGTTLASVTSLALNPYNSSEITIGLGNLGLVATSATAGVYQSINGGARWQAVPGDELNNGNPVAEFDALPGAVNSSGQLTAATADSIGRVTVAYARTGVTDNYYLYVLVTAPPAANPLPGGSVQYGTGQAGSNDQPAGTRYGSTSATNAASIYGLYKSGSSNTLGINAFTQVQVRDQQGGGPDESDFLDINFSNEDASNTGVLIVDPTDPNVVYVGGSEEYGAEGTFSDVGLIRIDTGNMVDTSYDDVDNQIAGGEEYLNDGDDQTKEAAAFDPTETILKFHYPTSTPQAYIGEGVSWLNVATGTFNNEGGDAEELPPNVTSAAIDAQGRIIFGTEQGLFRAVLQGTGYDFTSGDSGIIHQGGALGDDLQYVSDRVPTSLITISSINGNLQISDLTSVAIDPSFPGRLYTTEYNTGAAVTTGSLTFTSTGLGSGSINAQPSVGDYYEDQGSGGYLGDPDGDTVVVAPPNPTAPAGTLNTMYEMFAYGEHGSQEDFQIYQSTQGGDITSVVNVPDSGLGDTPAGYMPVLAIDPDKIVSVNEGTNQTDYLDGLLFGSNQVYVSRDSGANWTSLSGGAALSTRGGLITSAEFAASNDQVIWAATNLGEVFVTVNGNGGYSFVERDSGLSVGKAADAINSITVDPDNANIAFITENGAIYETVNGGVNWTNITGNLPAGQNYALVDDPRSQPGIGAANGRLYVGTQTGVYYSNNNGTTWTTLGIGLPHVPVVDLEFNASLEMLVAATEGRGAFEISTNYEGAYVVSVTPAVPVNGYVTPLTDVTVTFNEAISSFPASQVKITGPNGQTITETGVPTDVSTYSPGFPDPENVWEIQFAAQTYDGDYTFTIGPDVLNTLGQPMDQNRNGVNGEASDAYTFEVALNSTDDGEFVTGQYHDELGRDADTGGFIANLTPVDAARYAALATYATAYVTSARSQAIEDLYGGYNNGTSTGNPSIIGVGDLIQRAASTGASSEQAYWLGQLQSGITYEQMIVQLTSSTTYFAESRINGSDSNFITYLYSDLLDRSPGATQLAAYVAQLSSAETISRIQDARTLLSGQSYETLFIDNAFQEFLNRQPSSTELAQQLTFFNEGFTQGQIIAEIMSGPEYFDNDAPSVVGGGATPNNTTFVEAVYDQLLAGYTPAAGEEQGWINKLNAGTITADQFVNMLVTGTVYLYGTPTTTGNSGLVYTAYETYLGRAPSAAEVSSWQGVFTSDPAFRAEDLYANLLGSTEYFNNHTTTGTPLPSQDQQWTDALYTSVLGSTNESAESTRDIPFLTTAAVIAREAIAQGVVVSPEFRNDVVTYIFKSDLGHAPSAGQLAIYAPLVGLSGVAGGPNGDEIIISAVLSSQEFFLDAPVNSSYLHTNETWLTQLYPDLHLATSVSSLTAGQQAQIAQNNYNIDLIYAPARLAIIQGLQTSPEHYTYLTDQAYSTYLGRSPTATELAYWIMEYESGETQEQQIASLLSSGEYYDRTPTILGISEQPSSKSFIDAVYLQLFPGYTITSQEETAYENYLGVNSTAAQRLQAATGLINSSLYRFGAPAGLSGPSDPSIPNDGFVERAYEQYLGRAMTSAEITMWEMVYQNNPGFLTTSFLDTVFDSPEYMTDTHPFP